MPFDRDPAPQYQVLFAIWEAQMRLRFKSWPALRCGSFLIEEKDLLRKCNLKLVSI